MKHKELLFQVLPLSAVNAISFLVLFVDRSMLSQVSIEALAAVGIAPAILGVGMGATTGLITYVQRNISANKTSMQINSALSTALYVALAISIPIATMLFFLPSQIASLFFSGKTHELATDYLKIMSLMIPFFGMNQVAIGYYLGTLKAKYRLHISLLSAALAIIFNLILIPPWGVKGAAYGTVLTYVLTSLGNYIVVKKFSSFKFVRANQADLKEALSESMAIYAQQISYYIQTNFMNFLIAKISVPAFAIYNIVNMLLSIPSAIGMSYGNTVGTYLIPFAESLDFGELNVRLRKAIAQSVLAGFILAITSLFFMDVVRAYYFKDHATFLSSKESFWILSFLCFWDVTCCLFQRVHYSLGNFSHSFKRLMLSQWFFGAPLAAVAVLYFRTDVGGFFLCYAAERIFLSAALIHLWKLKYGFATSLDVRSMLNPNQGEARL